MRSGISYLFAAIFCTIFIGCETIEPSNVGETSFPIKQLHGREADLAEFPNLSDYDTEPADKIIVDMVTSEHMDIDYSGMFLRSFASPALFFSDITPCLSSTGAYELPYEDYPECYKIIDCSGIMISPNILMTAGHCTCLGFGFANDQGLPVYDDPMVNRTAKVIFRSYINLGREFATFIDSTDPLNYQDEVFNCYPFYEGWRDFNPGTQYCDIRDLDVSFIWCENNEDGVAPGEKYGFVDYEIDHFRKFWDPGDILITEGYPSGFPTYFFPLNPNELYYSLWQNPFYMDIYWNPANTWPPFGSGDDYFLFYGHKLISEGTSFEQHDNHDYYMIYAQHGGSGSGLFSRRNKLISGSGTNPTGLEDDENAGLESLWDGPYTRRIHLSIKALLDNFDDDDDYIFDFMSEEGGDFANIDLGPSHYYYLPLHDWHVRRGLWETDNLGSLFWNGAITPFDFIRGVSSVKFKVPFGVVKSRDLGYWRLVCDFRPFVCYIDYVLPPPELCLFTDGVPFDADSEYGIVVKFLKTFSIADGETLVNIGNSIDERPLEEEGLFNPTYNTLFIRTTSLSDSNLIIKQLGAGLTFIENVSVFKVNNSSEYDFTFNNWDEREIWRTWDGKSSEFWPWQEVGGISPDVGWAAVLLPTTLPGTMKNLTTYYIPFKSGMHYNISFESTSNRTNYWQEAGITFELRNANDRSELIDSASVDSYDVGYLDGDYFIWTDNSVELYAEDIPGTENDSYLLVIRRSQGGLRTIYIDNIKINENGVIAAQELIDQSDVEQMEKLKNGKKIRLK